MMADRPGSIAQALIRAQRDATAIDVLASVGRRVPNADMFAIDVEQDGRRMVHTLTGERIVRDGPVNVLIALRDELARRRLILAAHRYGEA